MEDMKVEDMLAKVALKGDFRKSVFSKLRKIYQAHIPKESNEITEIAEDAINEKVTDCLGWARELDLYPESEQTLQIKKKFGTEQCEVSKYLFTAITNHSINKVSAWGFNKKKNQHNYRARVVNNSEALTDDEYNSEEGWLSKFHDEQLGHSINAQELSGIDAVKFLNEKKLSESDISLILLRLKGLTFEEIAEHYENVSSVDKYRKQFDKAIKQADLSNLKSYLKVSNSGTTKH